MLRSIVISQKHKLIVILDHVGQETSSNSIVKSLIQQEDNDSLITCQDDNESNTQVPHYSILSPLSKSILKCSVEQIIKNIKSIKENPLVKQAFIWITPKNIEHPFIVPFVLYLADMTVEFVDNIQLIICQKKSQGTMQKRTFKYKFEKQSKTFLITESQKQHAIVEKPSQTNPEQLTTFKIGNFSAEELKAKAELEMSYEKIRKSTTIHYEPDEEDEDPDEDLEI